MKLRNLYSALLLLAGLLPAGAQMPVRTDSVMLNANPWLHIYGNSDTYFRQYPMKDVLELRFNDNSGQMIVNSSEKGDESVNMSDVSKWAIGPNVPRIDIDTYDYCYEITSKTEYRYGKLTLDGRGIFPDVTVDSMRIRGRGNSTWSMPKKPYRLKFKEKTKLCGLKKGKNYVLLANYMDKSLMRNFVADKFAQLIDMEYANHVIPVDVYLNGLYKGSYMLTEKIGFSNNSIDIPSLDEPNSILFELDTYDADADEHPFTTGYYNLPVRIKDPDAPEDPTEYQQWFKSWQDDLAVMEKAVYNGTNVWDQIDLDSFVKYVMVFNFCTNQELKHPKSCYLWKTKGQKYHFGPVWDFDWAFGYDDQWSGVNYQIPLFSSESSLGSRFFLTLIKTDTFLKRYAEIWNDFYQNHLQEFYDAFDAYADILQCTAALDATVLEPSYSYHSYIPTPEALRTWIEGHVEYINNPDNNYGLYSNSQGGWGGWDW